MKKPKTSEKRRGRPAKPASEKLEQFSIRLPAKLKFGLELLARAQHRSLSQAVEWALLRGLNGFEVGSERQPLGSIVDRAWTKDTETGRLLQVYRLAPELLSFEDLALCQVVNESKEQNETYEVEEAAFKVAEQQWKDEWAAHMNSGGAAPTWKPLDRAHDARREAESDIERFATVFWDQLRAKAIELANSGKPTSGLSIRDLLIGVKPGRQVSGLKSIRFFLQEMDAKPQ